MHAEFAPVAYITTALLFLPLPWHWRSGNVATLSIIAWLFITNIVYAVDATIWNGSSRITATVWCDISTKLIIGGNFALPAACLCLCIHLEKVASVRASHTTAADKRRRNLFELAMCWGLPVVFMALHYVVQGHRFDIFEDFGCRPATYFSIPSIFLVWVPPLVMATVALVYSCLAIRHFIIRRLSFSMHLQACNTALNTSRYLRLILMATVQLVWLVVVTSYTLWFSTVALPIRPWTNWADVHSGFSRIQTFPAVLTPDVILRGMTTVWWMVPASTWIFVAFFAFGNDAVEEYKRVLNAVLGGARRVVPEKFLPERKEKRGVKALSLPSFVMRSQGKGDGEKAGVSVTTATTTTANSMPPPYSLPAPPPPGKFMSALDSIDYESDAYTRTSDARNSDVDANRISISSSVDTSGYTIDIRPSTPSTPSTPSSPHSNYPPPPSPHGSHIVDDYYYTLSGSSPSLDAPPSPAAPPALPVPIHLAVPRMPSATSTGTTTPMSTESITTSSPTTTTPSSPISPPFSPYPFAREYRPAPTPTTASRPITYPSMSPTHREIAAVAEAQAQANASAQVIGDPLCRRT